MSVSKKLKTLVAIYSTKLLKHLVARYISAFDPKHPKILIVCFAGLGDNIWSIPMLTKIKEYYPLANITYLTNPVGREILQYTPYIDKFYVARKYSLWRNLLLWQRLHKESFQAVYILNAYKRSLLSVFSLLGAEKIISIENHVKGPAEKFSAVEKHPRTQHVIMTRLKSLRYIDIPIPKHIEHQLYWSAEMQQRADDFLTDHQLKSKKFIVFQVGASNQSRHWPEENFIQLGKWLYQTTKCPIIITGSPAERDKVQRIANAILDAIALYGQLPLAALPPLIEQAKLMVSADTGPMHIASATRTPLVALFACLNDRNTGPFNNGPKEIVKFSPATCKRLNMQSGVPLLPYEQVQKACEKLLAKLSNPAKSNRLPDNH